MRVEMPQFRSIHKVRKQHDGPEQVVVKVAVVGDLIAPVAQDGVFEAKVATPIFVRAGTWSQIRVVRCTAALIPECASIFSTDTINIMKSKTIIPGLLFLLLSQNGAGSNGSQTSNTSEVLLGVSFTTIIRVGSAVLPVKSCTAPAEAKVGQPSRAAPLNPARYMDEYCTGRHNCWRNWPDPRTTNGGQDLANSQQRHFRTSGSCPFF